MFVQAHPALWSYGVVAAVTVLYLSMTYAVGLLGREFELKPHEILVARMIDRVESASIDVFLPVCGEPFELIQNTWMHIRDMARRYDNVNVYVLDDGHSSKVCQLAEGCGFKYIARWSNELKKAGNLRNAFKKTNGEFIAIFDADFCPRPDFLLETIPYFFADERIAIVQTPQFFDVYQKNNWVMNAAGAVQELFYRLIQVNRDRFGGSVCVGTNAVYRRSALEPFGGTAPMPYSEDVHTGFQLISNGWKIKYIPIILAEGVCPSELKAFFTQQYRWAMGSISLFFSSKFWKADITGWQRICYLTGMFFYITTGLSVILSPIPTLVMLGFFPDKVHWYNLLFAIPSFMYGTFFMAHWMKLPFSLDVLRIRQVSYFAHLFALVDFLTGKVEAWQPTGGSVVSKRFQFFKPFACFIWIGSIVSVAGLTVLRISQGHSLIDFALVIAFWWFQAVLVLPIIDHLRSE